MVLNGPAPQGDAHKLGKLSKFADQTLLRENVLRETISQGGQKSGKSQNIKGTLEKLF